MEIINPMPLMGCGDFRECEDVENQLIVGASYDDTKVNYRTETELGTLTVSRGKTRSGLLLDEVRFVVPGSGGNTYRILESIYAMLKSAAWHKRGLDE